MLWQLSTNELLVFFGFVCCLSYISGWLADGIMGTSAFGHIGNWLLLLLGCFTATYVFNMYGYEFRTDLTYTLLYIVGGTSLFFVFMCTSKRLLIR